MQKKHYYLLLRVVFNALSFDAMPPLPSPPGRDMVAVAAHAVANPFNFSLAGADACRSGEEWAAAARSAGVCAAPPAG